jgi:SOS response regulatory protein OraA/RecX
MLFGIHDLHEFSFASLWLSSYLVTMKSYSVKWHKGDLRVKAPRRLNQALIETGETLDSVIRTGVLMFIEAVEEDQCALEEYPKWSSHSLGAEPKRVQRVQAALARR